MEKISRPREHRCTEAASQPPVQGSNKEQKMPKFSGFPVETLKFLEELERHNNREWFQANKPRYEEVVLEPALDFIATMSIKL